MINVDDLNDIQTDVIYEYTGPEIRPTPWPVRCVDCASWNPDQQTKNHSAPCDEWSDYESGMTRYTGATDFCSFAERKEDE